MVSKYDHRYLDLAKFFSTWSKDPSAQIGAVAIGDKGQVLAQGYNGWLDRRICESLYARDFQPILNKQKNTHKLVLFP